MLQLATGTPAREDFFMKQLKKVNVLVFCALMAAIGVILGYVTSIQLGPFIRISFSEIPNRIIEYGFGPIVRGIFGETLDILKYLIKPTGPFFFGFTFNAILSGVIYGLLLYKKSVHIGRILMADLIVKIIVHCILGTLWLSILYGSPFLVILPARILNNVIMWPIDSFILFLILKYVKLQRFALLERNTF